MFSTDYKNTAPAEPPFYPLSILLASIPSVSPYDATLPVRMRHGEDLL